MSSTINASSAGIVQTADSSGTLQVQTGGQSALYVDASQNITIPKNLTVQGTLTFTGGGGSVSTVSGGSTGLTPSTPASGNVVLGGTLLYSSGGTGLASTGASGNILSSTGSGWQSISLASANIATLGSANFTGTVTSTAAIYSTVSSGYAALQSNAVGIGNSTSTISSTGTGFTLTQTGTTIGNWSSSQLVPVPTNTLSLGSAGLFWTTVYATNGTINTSDYNAKQQIAELTPTELTVARSLKGLIRTFKFNSSVAEKGDGARIHTGVIAQDVFAAFAAQGLDASRYALYCSDTWYEVDGKVLDEHGNNYNANSPNAVSKTQLGIRYDELLAFIIAGM